MRECVLNVPQRTRETVRLHFCSWTIRDWKRKKKFVLRTYARSTVVVYGIGDGDDNNDGHGCSSYCCYCCLLLSLLLVRFQYNQFESQQTTTIAQHHNQIQTNIPFNVFCYSFAVEIKSTPFLWSHTHKRPAKHTLSSPFDSFKWTASLHSDKDQWLCVNLN